MNTVWYVAGVLVFAFAILTSIGLHELGHLIPAKAFGGKVTQYFIGFGPTLWSRTRGETEYGVKAIPLGGYVKIVGMLPPGAAQGRASTMYDEDGELVTTIRGSSTGLFTQLISDARAAEWEHIRPGDEPRLFYRMAWWKKVVVMAAGPSVNIAIAFFLFWGVFGLYGNYADTARPVVGTVSQCVIPASQQRTTCQAGDPESPAARAGLRSGDLITSFNGTPVTDSEQLRALIRTNRDGSAVIDYERAGRASSTTVNTTVTLVQQSADDQRLVQAGFLGVTFTRPLVKGGPIYTVKQMGDMTAQTVTALVHLPVKVYGVAEAIVGERPRDQNSPMSIVGGGRIAGEVVSQQGDPVSDKIAFLVTLIASFNFFIGAFNFVPLLPLDGGHIVSALWEAVRRGWARLRRRPDPGHVDAAKLLPIAYVAASAMLVMSLVLIVGDLVVPIQLGS